MLRNDYKGGNMSPFKAITSISSMIITSLGVSQLVLGETDLSVYEIPSYETASEIQYFEYSQVEYTSTTLPVADISVYKELDTSFIVEAVSNAQDQLVLVRQSAPNPSLTVQETLPELVASVENDTVAERGAQIQVAEPPSPPQWTGPIAEYYGPGSGCTQEQATIVANIMWQHNASDDTVAWMLKTMSRESTCDSSAHNDNRRTGDNSWGLCQLNVLAGFFKDGNILAEYDYTLFASDFTYNVYACVKLWTVCGRGPWNYGNYYCSKP